MAAFTITGQVIDLNSEITAGQPTDWTLSLPSTLLVPGFFGIPVPLATYQVEYELGWVAPVVSLPADATAGTSAISATYDAVTNLITVDNVAASSGSATVLVDGGIMSTDPLGELSVNGGLGMININNQTGVPIVLQNLYAGSAASAAASSSTVELIDTTKMVHTVLLPVPGRRGLHVHRDREAGSIPRRNGDDRADSGPARGGNPDKRRRHERHLRTAERSAVGGWNLQASLTRTDNFGNQNTWSIGQWQWSMPSGQPNDPWSYCSDEFCDFTTLTPTGYLVTGSSDTSAFDSENISGSINFTDGWNIDYHGCGGGLGSTCNYGFTENETSGCAGSDAGSGDWFYNVATAATLEAPRCPPVRASRSGSTSPGSRAERSSSSRTLR